MATGTPGAAVRLHDEPRRLRVGDEPLHRLPGVAHLGRVVDVAPDVRLVRTLTKRSAVALSTTSYPTVGGGHRLVLGVDLEPLPQVDVVGRRAGRAAPRPSGRGRPRLLEDLVDLSLGGLISSSSSAGTDSRRAAPSHAAYSTTAGQRPYRRLHRGVRRHRATPRGGPGHVRHPQQLRHALASEERRDERLVGLLADRREHVGDRLAGGVERRDVDGDHRVDVGVVDRRVQGVLEVLGGGSAPRRSRSSSRPLAAAASTASRPSASELPTTATRDRRGSGWWATSCATSNISSSVSTWMMPACRNIASTASGGRRSADRVTHRHALVGGPDRTAMIGLAGRPGGRSGRTCAGCRSTRGRAASPRWRRPPPSTAGGRCRRRPHGCRR